MGCKHDILKARDLGVSVTSSHRAIPQWTWYIAGIWKGIHIIEGSPNDLVMFPGSTSGMQLILLQH